MSNEQQKSAQIATEPTPAQSNNNASVERSLPKPPVLPSSLRNLDAGLLATAEGFHIPLKDILTYVGELEAYNASVEARLNGIIEQFDPAVKAVVGNMVKEAQEQAQKQAQSQQMLPSNAANPSNPMGMLGQLAQLGQLFGLGGGGGQDELRTLAMDSLKADIAFSRELKNTFMAKLGSKVVNQLVDAVPP